MAIKILIEPIRIAYKLIKVFTNLVFFIFFNNSPRQGDIGSQQIMAWELSYGFINSYIFHKFITSPSYTSNYANNSLKNAFLSDSVISFGSLGPIKSELSSLTSSSTLLIIISSTFAAKISQSVGSK